MKFNPLRWFRRSARPPGPALLAVTPPRTGQRTLLGVENLLGSIAAPEPFALELAADECSIGLFVRCAGDQIVRGQVGVHYPQARVRDVPSQRDYMRLDEDEQAWSLVLRASGPEYAPLRVFRDQDLVDPGSDPLLAPLGALTGLKEGERLVSRLLLRSLGPQWSRHYQEKAQPEHLQREPKPNAPPPSGTGPDPLALTVLGLAAFGFFQGYRWLQAGEIWNL
ncbi:MAG: hypothetical protein F4Y14_21820, partial [Acidobacteria bacterium]|nr:hypothetical protein [Acidobacteriota bacterium]